MHSRQIQIFGLVGISILILFIVIFLGRDFHKLYQHYMYDISLPTLQDDQIVMESQAVENLKNMLNDESGKILAKYDQKQGHTTKNLKENIQKVALASEKTELPTKSNPRILQQKNISNKERPEDITRSLRLLLDTTPFFRDSLTLNESNKAVLNKILKKLHDISYPYKLQIEGHTQKGVAKYISVEMANKVAAYLKEKLPGIEIQSVGYGNLYPVSDDLQDLANRRIEIIVRRSDV